MFEERKINPNLQKQYREQGYWKDETLLDCWDRTVETYPEREYVVDDRGNRYTYRELDEAAGRVASYLIGLGIQPGEVVSFQLPIWSEFAMLTIACYKVGAVAHPIAMSYEEKELARSLNITESRCYFGPTFFYKTDYEDRILAVRDQAVKGYRADRQCERAKERCSFASGNSYFLWATSERAVCTY